MVPIRPEPKPQMHKRLCLGPTMAADKNLHAYIYIYIRIQNIYEALPPCTLRAVPSLICYGGLALIHEGLCPHSYEAMLLHSPTSSSHLFALGLQSPLSLSFSLFIYTYVLKMQKRLAAAYFWSKSCGKTKPNMPLWTGPRCNEYSSLYQMNIHL